MTDENPRRVMGDAAGAEAVATPNRSTIPRLPTLVEAALRYAEHEWRVFPCCAPNCQGHKGQPCEHPGKRPLVRSGFKSATTDPELIKLWWRRWPGANVGIATGRASGLIVIDIDGESGLKTLQALVAAHGPLPRTAIVRTARGWHLYFSLRPDGPRIRCSAGAGLDVRGDGGYVVAPPSIHLTGHIYQWWDHVG
jgi:putative DNA primase/helicase